MEFGGLCAPTFAAFSVRLLGALACELDLDLSHFDIDLAFVRADLQGYVFMRLPERCGSLSGKITRLIKSFYGLKQGSRQPYTLLYECLLALGFERCLTDSCVCRLIERGEVALIVVVHGDDILP